MKFFNTEGAIKPESHYCLDPLSRFDLEDIKSLIDNEKYFVLHAPRQTGKTSSMLALMKHLNKEAKYKCLYCNAEGGQSARENVGRALKAIVQDISNRANHYLNDSFLKNHHNEIFQNAGEDYGLNTCLTEWAEQSEKPIVLIIDEIDSLVGDSLISVLRQLRAGYDKRPKHFPQSVILCGVRDIRDYRIHSSTLKDIVTGGSCFNIKAESLRLGDFSKDDVFALINEHTKETGQVFEIDAKEKVWYYSQGQPWLTNALCYEACFRMKIARDRKVPITCQLIDIAKENLIMSRATHLDQLTDKLKEPRVKSIIELLLRGDIDKENIKTDDIQYVEDLGLIKTKGQIKISNPIYQEIIPRELTYSTQVFMVQELEWYQNPDGSLDMNKLITAFQEFFVQNSEIWLERLDYKEAGPQLLMQAFLQRITNGGGMIEREYGLGLKRTDLYLKWFYGDGKTQHIVIELKILWDSFETTLKKGLEQTHRYMDKCLSENGHLIIFDRSKTKSWAEKVFKLEKEYAGKKIVVWGM